MNTEERKEYMKAWRKENQKKIKEYRKQYYKEHNPNKMKVGHVDKEGEIVWDRIDTGKVKLSKRARRNLNKGKHKKNIY